MLFQAVVWMLQVVYTKNYTQMHIDFSVLLLFYLFTSYKAECCFSAIWRTKIYLQTLCLKLLPSYDSSEHLV